MNVLKPMPELPEADDRHAVPVGRDTALPPAIAERQIAASFIASLRRCNRLGANVAIGSKVPKSGQAAVQN
jgi:hypothetical protein